MMLFFGFRNFSSFREIWESSGIPLWSKKGRVQIALKASSQDETTGSQDETTGSQDDINVNVEQEVLASDVPTENKAKRIKNEEIREGQYQIIDKLRQIQEGVINPKLKEEIISSLNKILENQEDSKNFKLALKTFLETSPLNNPEKLTLLTNLLQFVEERIPELESTLQKLSETVISETVFDPDTLRDINSLQNVIMELNGTVTYLIEEMGNLGVTAQQFDYYAEIFQLEIKQIKKLLQNAGSSGELAINAVDRRLVELQKKIHDDLNQSNQHLKKISRQLGKILEVVTEGLINRSSAQNNMFFIQDDLSKKIVLQKVDPSYVQQSKFFEQNEVKQLLGDMDLTDQLLNDIYSLINKMRRGDILTPEEEKKIGSIGVSKLVLLTEMMGSGESSMTFDSSPDSVMRVSFNLKDKNFLVEKPFVRSSGNQEIKGTQYDSDLLNAMGYCIEFFFIVVKNDTSNPITLDELVIFFKNTIWDEYIRGMVNQNIILESILIKVVHPKNQAYRSGSHQLSFGESGSLTDGVNETMPRPFVLTATSKLVMASKNDFLIRLHGISKGFENFNEKITSKNLVNNLANTLQSILKVGNNESLWLKLCFKTTRIDSMFNYVPVGSISVAGFYSASNPQAKLRSMPPMNTDGKK